MKWARVGLLFFLARCSDDPRPSLGDSGTSGADAPPTYYPLEKLKDPEACKDCHPKHYESWSGSMHAYASDDPNTDATCDEHDPPPCDKTSHRTSNSRACRRRGCMWVSAPSFARPLFR